MANHFAIFYPRAFGFFAKELEIDKEKI